MELQFNFQLGHNKVEEAADRRLNTSLKTMARRAVLALALASAANAFTVPSGGTSLKFAPSSRPAVAQRPVLRTGTQAMRATYEPAIRIGHGFDIHRLGMSLRSDMHETILVANSECLVRAFICTRPKMPDGVDLAWQLQ